MTVRQNVDIVPMQLTSSHLLLQVHKSFLAGPGSRFSSACTRIYGYVRVCPEPETLQVLTSQGERPPLCFTDLP